MTKKKNLSKYMAVAATTTLAVSSLGTQGIVFASPADEESSTPLTTASPTKITKFTMYSDLESLSKYNESFQVDPANIKVSNNGGAYNSSSQLQNIFDGNLNTFWETSKANSTSFTNEITFTFDDVTEFNRVIYAPRLVGAPGKGFPLEFEIQGRASVDDEYEVVAEGSYTSNVRDAIEIQFDSAQFKQLKFVFKNANQNWAAASEFMFYTEDVVANKMARLFTDSTLTEVSEEFKTLEALVALEKTAKAHPFYEQLYQDSIHDAKVLLEAAKAITASTAEMQSFNYYNNEDYVEQYMVPISNIKSITNNGRHYSNQVITNAVDGNLSTYWETNTTNTNSFKNTVEVEFKEAVEINRLVYGARPDKKGFANTFDLYISPTSKGDTYQLVSSGSQSTVAGLVEAKFDPTTAKRVKFVINTSNQNWATLSELAFFKEDKVSATVSDLFTNGLMNELKPAYKDSAVIDKLAEQVAAHPLRESLDVYVNLAKEVLTGDPSLQQSIVTGSQRGNANAMASKYQIARTSFSLETFGKYVVPGETFQVFVDADPNGVMPTLVLGQIADDRNGWQRKYTLKPGLNTFTAPAYSNMKPAVVYIENGALPSEQAYAPKARLVGGTKFPVYVHGVTDPAAFEKELTAYVEKISVNDDDFANGNPENGLVYNVTELVSENNTISTSAAGALKGVQEMKAYGKTVKDTMDEWELMWETFQKINGNFEVDKDPTKFYTAKFTSRVFTNGPYGWSDWGYTGYNGGNTARRDSGFFKQIVQPMSMPGNDGWAYYHEWGHNINNASMEHVEVTNNIYSVVMRKVIQNSDADRVDWTSLYKRFSGEPPATLGFWTNLGIIMQVQYYYGEETYGKATQLAIQNPDGILNGLNNQQRMVVAFSLATGYNLVDFFADWKYTTATDAMRQKVAHLPKQTVKLEYMNTLGRGYTGPGFSDDANVTIKSLVTNATNNTNTLTFNIDDENKEASMGYEILRNGEVVGYTTETSFVDKNIDPNENYTYAIIAYDKKLKPSNATEAQSFQPVISAADSVTVKLRQDFDAATYVKARNYKGEDITDTVKVKSSNVDVTKKGDYEVVYEVTSEGITTTKAMNVTVTSDIVYVSDIKEASAVTGWNGLRKNIAPQGTTITLLRAGLPVTYAKGLGAHASSEIVYNIEGKGYSTFESYIGIDQAVKGNAYTSAKFEIWVDDELKFTSGTFNSSTDQEFVKVDVQDAMSVKLVTKDAGSNGITADHTVWADAKFTHATSKPTINVSESFTDVKYKGDFNLLDGVTAFDPEDGDMTAVITVDDGGYSPDKPGLYDITYTVTDSDGATASATKQVYVYSESKYASDVAWASATASWGNVTKDKSVQNQAIKLLIANETKVLEKGIGTHADSEIVYNLEGKNFDYFEAFVGVERNVAQNTSSSITFTVLADGKEVFNSGVMNYNTPAKLVNIPLKGVKQLKLIVDDGGNNAYDHAAWGDAKFYTSNGIPELTIPSSVATKVGEPVALNEAFTATDAEDGDITENVQVIGLDEVNFNQAGDYTLTYKVVDGSGNEVVKMRTVSVVDMNDFTYLSDANWKSESHTYTAPKKDVAAGGNPLRLTGENNEVVTYEKGIGAHSTSTIIYDLTDKKAAYFSSYVGVDRLMYNSVGSVGFQVYVDGVKKYDSGTMTAKVQQKYIEVPLVGAKELKLVVTDGGNGQGSDHATWGDAKLHFANANRAPHNASEQAETQQQ